MNKLKKITIKKSLGAALGIVLCSALLLTVVPVIHNSLYPVAATVAAKKQLPIYCVNTGEDKKVAISFDAAWGADDTDRLLDILKENDVKATFFLCGYWVDKYPNEVKKIYESGHDIGNHSNTHPHSSKLSLEENKNNIKACHDKIKNLLGYEAFLYRPPFGEYNDTVLNAAKECGYYSIQWDIDSLDWKNLGVENEINKVVNNPKLGNGSIILFHNDAKYTPDCLDTILKSLKEKGYEIVPVSELIMRDGFYMDTEGRQQPTVNTANTEITTNNENTSNSESTSNSENTSVS